MVDYNNAISVIRDNGGFKPNEDDSSYYRTYILKGSKPSQIRISNHGTHLWTWDKNGGYIPSYAINICVVFMSGTEGYSGPNTSVEMAIKDEKGNVIGHKKDYEIIEYVYDCDNLSSEDCAMINKEIVSIPTNGGFKDPFSEDTVNHCSVYRLHPNTNPELIKESKTNKNMKKNIIKLNENSLKQIVTESVKKVLKEEGIFKKSLSLSSDGDERLAVNNAIHELTEAVSILNKFLENGMMEKRLLEMADTYC